jgi:hypothetical protein
MTSTNSDSPESAESVEHASIQRESLPGTLEHIRSQLVPQLAADWGKLYVTGRVSGEHASCECSYSLRGSEARVPLALANADVLAAAVRELHGRMREEMLLSWRGINLEYDADKEYSVSISTS